MKLTTLFAGAVLAAAAASASAAGINHTYDIVLDDENSMFGDQFAAGNAGKSFLDIFTFSVSGNSTVGSSLTSILSAGHDLDITSFGLYSGTTLIAAGKQVSTGSLESWTLDAAAPTLGTYSFVVGGTVIGAKNVAFTGNAYVTAVPEPATWSMLAGSLAILGFLGRRRKPGAAPGCQLPA